MHDIAALREEYRRWGALQRVHAAYCRREITAPCFRRYAQLVEAAALALDLALGAERRAA